MSSELEANGPRPADGYSIAVWRGEVNEKLRSQGTFIKDIDNAVTGLATKVDEKHMALNEKLNLNAAVVTDKINTQAVSLGEKINEVKATVSKLVIYGGVGMFILNIVIVISTGLLLKWLSKGM